MFTFIIVCIVIYIAYRLITRPAPVDTRLLEACNNDETRDDAFRLIKTNPELVNVADNNGITPLMVASVKGDSRLMKELINHGANVNAVTRRGHTALMLVCMHSTCESVYGLLVDSGSVINARSKDGMTALGYVEASGCNVGLMLYLQGHGAIK